MTQYFFTTSSLPPLKMGEEPEITFDEFETLLQENLLPWDYKETQVIRRYYDILNIRAFINGNDLDTHANLNANELEEAILDQVGLPSYVIEFLQTYQTSQERLKYFPSLIFKFSQEETKKSHSFLKEYLHFERCLQLILVGFRAKKLNRNLEKELQLENPHEELVAQILAQKDAPEFEPPEGFEELKPIFEAYQDNPIKLFQALCEYRFEKIEKMMGTDVFSFSKILGYMAQLIIVERWMELNEMEGLEKIQEILEKSNGEKEVIKDE